MEQRAKLFYKNPIRIIKKPTKLEKVYFYFVKKNRRFENTKVRSFRDAP